MTNGLLVDVLFDDGPPPNRIQALRLDRGMSRERLAATVGVTLNTIGRWETTDGLLSASVRHLLAVAHAFKLPAVAILPALDGLPLDVPRDPHGDR